MATSHSAMACECILSEWHLILSQTHSRERKLIKSNNVCGNVALGHFMALSVKEPICLEHPKERIWLGGIQNEIFIRIEIF